MEWMLQVVDELDDAFGAARHLLGLTDGLGGFLESLGASMRLRGRSPGSTP